MVFVWSIVLYFEFLFAKLENSKIGGLERIWFFSPKNVWKWYHMWMRNIVGMEWRIIKSHSAPSFSFMKLLIIPNLIQTFIQKLKLIILENTFILISIYDLGDAHKLSSYFLKIHLTWNVCVFRWVYILRRLVFEDINLLIFAD